MILDNSTLDQPLSAEDCKKVDEKCLKLWIAYSGEMLEDRDVYNKRQFIDRNYYFYHASSDTPIKDVYAPPGQQVKHFNDKKQSLNDVQKFFFSWLSSATNVAIFVKHASAEEKRVGVNTENNSKERGKFCRYKIWQFIFRFLQDETFAIFGPEVQKVASQTSESSHRFLAEFCCGAIHASKLWTYEQMAVLRNFLLPILDAKFSAVSEDTVSVWNAMLSHALKDVDPMRMQWFFEWLFNKLLASLTPSQYNRLGCILAHSLTSLVVCMNFEGNYLKERLLKLMLPFLGNRFTKYRKSARQLVQPTFQGLRKRFWSQRSAMFRCVASCFAFYNDKHSWCKSSEPLMDLRLVSESYWMPVVEEIQDVDFTPPVSADESSADSPAAITLNKISSCWLILVFVLIRGQSSKCLICSFQSLLCCVPISPRPCSTETSLSAISSCLPWLSWMVWTLNLKT